MSYSSVLENLSTFESCAEFARPLMQPMKNLQTNLGTCVKLSVEPVVSQITALLRTHLLYAEENIYIFFKNLSWLYRSAVMRNNAGWSGPCVSTPWRDCSPSPSSPPASLLSGIRLTTRPACLRSAHELLQRCSCWENIFPRSRWSTCLPLPSAAN